MDVIDCLTPKPIIDFNSDQLNKVRKTFECEDVNKLRQAIDIFQDWIKKQEHFVVTDFDRSYLERYLIANKCSVERAKQRFDRLCTLRNLMPELLKGYDIRNEFDALLRCSYNCVLPKPTPDNYRVICVTIYSDDHEQTNMMDYYRYMIAFIEYMLCHDYNAGYEIVMDMRNLTLSMVPKLNPVIMNKALTLLVEGFGLRLKALHAISESKFLDIVVRVFKQALSSKLKERLHIHKTIESLYDYIPKEILPEDFGGGAKSFKELSDLGFKELCSDAHVARMKFLESAVTDETRRQICKFNEEYCGMPGSFKTLCVD